MLKGPMYFGEIEKDWSCLNVKTTHSIAYVKTSSWFLVICVLSHVFPTYIMS